MDISGAAESVVHDVVVCDVRDPHECGEFDITLPSVGDLGFEHASYAEICARGLDFGLELCPKRLGIELRLEHATQPSDEWLGIAMEVNSSYPERKFISVEHRAPTHTFWLDATTSIWVGRPCLFSKDKRFAFVRPRR